MEGEVGMGGIPDSQPKANLKSKTPPQAKIIDSLAVRHAHPASTCWYSWLHTPTGKVWVIFMGLTELPSPKLMCHGWEGAAGPDLRRWGEAVGGGGEQWQLLQQAVEQEE